jgi:NitT/TauT family transport system substrate-binding protein
MTMTRRTTFTLCIAALLLAGLLLALSGKRSRVGNTSQPPQRLVFAVASLIDSAPAYIARQRDFYAQEGVDVELRFYRSGKEALAAVLRGEAHLATVADLPIALAVLDGADLRVLATICKSGRENSLVARKDRGISTPDQVRGKTVGIIPGTTSEFLLDEFLVLHGIPRPSITVVQMRPEETVAALRDGKVDAVSTWGQHTASLLKSLGDNGVRFFSEETYQMYWNVASSGAFVASHEDSLRRIIKALGRGSSYILQHDDAAQKMVMEAVGLDREQMAALWPDYEFEQTLDQSLILTLEHQARWALQRNNRQPRQVPDFRRVVYVDPLADINPTAVTVIR